MSLRMHGALSGLNYLTLLPPMALQELAFSGNYNIRDTIGQFSQSRKSSPSKV